MMHTCVSRMTPEQEVLIALGGKAAVEMYYPEQAAAGCSGDLEKAIRAIQNRISSEGTMGFGLVDIRSLRYEDPSPFLVHKGENAIQAELEKRLFQTRGILMKNKEFLEKTAAELVLKGTLLHSDVQRIKKSCVLNEDTKKDTLLY